MTNQKRNYRVISADGHLEIPPERLLPHLPKQYHDRAPRLVKLDEGGEALMVEGWPLIKNGSNLLAGRKPGTLALSYFKTDGSSSPGTGDARQRLREQDEQGIDAEVLFPPVYLMSAIQRIEDKKVYRAIVRAYNEYLAKEFCPVAPDRLIAPGAIPASGIDDAVAELKWCREAGLKAVNLSQFPSGTPVPQPSDDRFWEAALGIDMPITAHTHFGHRYPTALAMSPPPPMTPADRLASRQAFTPPMMTIAQLLHQRVFDRFPKLQLYFAETQASWLGCALYQLDENAEMYSAFLDWGPERRKPSEYIREHVYFGIIRDPNCTKMGDLVPVDRLMFGTDFPHGIGAYPDSSKWIERTFSGTPDALRRKVLLENPARYFGLNLESAITPTPN
jgi:predicted TIM-barrel fold metal-dependent hydrolase